MELRNSYMYGVDVIFHQQLLQVCYVTSIVTVGMPNTSSCALLGTVISSVVVQHLLLLATWPGVDYHLTSIF